MARYLIKEGNKCSECFLNIDDAQNYLTEKFDAKLINRQLHNKNGDKKTIEELYKENGLDFMPLKHYVEQLGFYEREVINVHIENSKLVITIKDIGQKTIEC